MDEEGALRTTSASPTVEAVLEEVASRSLPQSAAENFPVALRIVPAPARRQLLRLYAFARFIDDVGDEAPGDRTILLDAVDADLAAAASGTARLTPVRGLQPLLEAGVPVDEFRKLVEANRRDQRVHSYESFDDLIDYCSYSAAPVGRVVLHVAGAPDPACVAASDAVCAGLQVLEHCQDVGEDARAGRIYLPQRDLRAAGGAPDDPLATSASPALRSVVGLQVQRARELLAPGRDLVRQLSGWARVAIAGYVAGGLATADALDSAGHEVLGRAVRPSRLTTARHALVLLARAR